MLPSDFDRFRAVLAGMAEIYQRELSVTFLDAYWLALRSWELEDFETAAAHLMANAKFMPRPADFNELRKAALLTPGEAWTLALAHASSGGYRSIRRVGDELTDRVVAALGGYRVIAMCEDDKLGFLERRFAEHYETMQDAEDIRQAVPSIARHNGMDRLGHDSEKFDDEAET